MANRRVVREGLHETLRLEGANFIESCVVGLYAGIILERALVGVERGRVAAGADGDMGRFPAKAA